MLSRHAYSTYAHIQAYYMYKNKMWWLGRPARPGAAGLADTAFHCNLCCNEMLLDGALVIYMGFHSFEWLFVLFVYAVEDKLIL